MLSIMSIKENRKAPSKKEKHWKYDWCNPSHLSVTTIAVRCIYQQDSVTMLPSHISVKPLHIIVTIAVQSPTHILNIFHFWFILIFSHGLLLFCFFCFFFFLNWNYFISRSGSVCITCLMYCAEVLLTHTESLISWGKVIVRSYLCFKETRHINIYFLRIIRTFICIMRLRLSYLYYNTLSERGSGFCQHYKS